MNCTIAMSDVSLVVFIAPMAGPHGVSINAKMHFKAV